MEPSSQSFRNVLQLGIQLSSERDANKLLTAILEQSMALTNCDAATVYTYQNDKLHFKVMKTLSLGIFRGGDGENIEDLPPVPLREENVCAYTAIHNQIVNIEDVYHTKQFDFSGPKKYDLLIGYRTQSMLVIPLADTRNELIGVLQLINARNARGAVISFASEYELIVHSLASLTAMELSNLKYVSEIKNQMYSFVEAMATAVDERTPYNASHARNVAKYVMLLAEYMNQLYEQGRCKIYFDKNTLEQMELAALVHDIGKMIVPLSVMNRATRLDEEIQQVEDRFALIRAKLEIDYLRGRISEGEWKMRDAELKEDLSFIYSIEAGFLTDEKYKRVQKIAQKYYTAPDGTVTMYLTEHERNCLSIRKGTLTEEYRKCMQSHVTMTAKILSKVHFKKEYQNVPIWASQHHELLDGEGYPNHLFGEDIPIETRILTIADIYDALTARDRPYRKAIPQQKALEILDSMGEEGKLDQQLTSWFREMIKIQNKEIDT